VGIETTERWHVFVAPPLAESVTCSSTGVPLVGRNSSWKNALVGVVLVLVCETSPIGVGCAGKVRSLIGSAAVVVTSNPSTSPPGPCSSRTVRVVPEVGDRHSALRL
jgi:hypothetical protein